MRVELPPLDQFGPWPVRLVPPRWHHARKLPLDTTGAESVAYYIEEAHKAWVAMDEHRARRLAIENELSDSVIAYREREPAEIRYVERKVYTPMPPREVIKKITIDRQAPMAPSILIVPPPGPTVEVFREPSPRPQPHWLRRLWWRVSMRGSISVR